MKKRAYVYAIGILLISISCNNSNKKQATDTQKSEEMDSPALETGKPLASADYSSLLINYDCDMTATQVAKIFNIPETDVIHIDNKLPNRCDFEIKGFGKNGLGGTKMMWGSAPSNKAEIKRMIQNSLKRQANNENMFGDGIELSETDDCYIIKTPRLGRITILNENYDSGFYFDFSQRGLYKDRTEEQHDELIEKTIALANYLLKKHRK